VSLGSWDTLHIF